MRIKVLLELFNGVVQYPGDFEKWSNATFERDIAGLDWLVGDYDGEPTFTYVPWQEIIDYGRKITKLAFRNRWTNEEHVAVELASLDNPSGTLEERQTAATLRVIKANIDNAAYIDLDRPDTVAGVTFVLNLMRTLLGYNQAKYAERFNAILNTPVAKEEVPIWPQ